jgi:hypothetical protein
VGTGGGVKIKPAKRWGARRWRAPLFAGRGAPRRGGFRRILNHAHAAHAQQFDNLQLRKLQSEIHRIGRNSFAPDGRLAAQSHFGKAFRAKALRRGLGDRIVALLAEIRYPQRLKPPHATEAKAVVGADRDVVDTVGATQLIGIVGPIAAAQHPGRASGVG